MQGVVSNRKQSMSFGTFNTILTSIMATSGKEKKVSAEAQQKQADSRKEGKVLKDCTRFSKPANKWLMPMSLACDKFTVQRCVLSLPFLCWAGWVSAGVLSCSCACVFSCQYSHPCVCASFLLSLSVCV